VLGERLISLVVAVARGGLVLLHGVLAAVLAVYATTVISILISG
jgi:hypothetical protein